MTAARYDLTIDQGSDFSLMLTIKENGTLKNLSGWHGRGAFRKTLDGGKAGDLTVSVVGRGAGEKDQPESDHGKLNIALGFATSAGLTAGTYLYDIEIYYNDSADATTGATKVTRVIGGSLNLRREVTR